MKIIVDEQSFKAMIEANPKVLVFFYREKGCSFCTKMKPIMEELSNTHDIAWYELGQNPDSVTEGLVNAFPTFAAFVDGKLVGKQEGAMSAEQVLLTFTPDLIPKKAPASIASASMIQLLTDEAAMIDQIGPLRSHLAKIQKEIEKRKKMAMGKVDCCDSCADGGGCEGGCH